MFSISHNVNSQNVKVNGAERAKRVKKSKEEGEERRADGQIS